MHDRLLADTQALPVAEGEPRRDQARLAYAWYVVVVLMVCYTLSFIDRQILSLLVGPIKADLGISDTRMGLLGGLAFSLFYTAMGLPIGVLVDRHNRRNIIVTGVLFWSAMTAACAAAKSFGGLFLARMGVGVGEATLGPAAMSLISDYFPRERLATAMSVYSMGVFIGSGLALVVGGVVVQALSQSPVIDLALLGPIASWRLTFLVVGLPGVLVALWLFTIREPARRDLLDRTGRASPHLSLREVAAVLMGRWRSVLGLSLGMMFTGMCVYAFLFWTPAFLQRAHGWTPQQTGVALGTVILLGGCLGMYLGGRLSDRWMRGGRRDAALRVATIGCAGSLPCFAAAYLLPEAPWLSVLLFGPGVAFAAMPTGSCYAALQMILPNQVRGQAVALFLFVLNLGGLTLGPLLPGVFNDYLFGDERMIGPSTALATSLSALAGAIVFLWARRPYREDHRLTQP